MIISLSAKLPRAGKDTVFEGVAKALHNHNVCRLAFADALKDELVDVLYNHDYSRKMHLRANLDTNVKDVDLISINSLSLNPFVHWLACTQSDLSALRSPRWYLWQYGTNYVRDYLQDNTRWLNITLRKISEIQKADPTSIIFITDTRFPLELDGLKAIGAKTVMLNPQDFPDDWYNPATLSAFLASPIETALRDHKFDLQLINKYDQSGLTVRELVEFINPHL